jgi:hypothetical protein
MNPPGEGEREKGQTTERTDKEFKFISGHKDKTNISTENYYSK